MLFRSESNQQDIESVDLKCESVPMARKLDLSKDRVFMLKEQDNMLRQNVYNIYIPISVIPVVKLDEKLDFESSTTKHFKQWYQLTINNDDNILCYGGHYSRLEQNSFGIEVDKMSSKLEGLSIDIRGYELERLIKNFKLVERKQKIK